VWDRISANASRYFIETHALDVVMPEFERMLVEAARGRRTAAIPRMTTPRLVS